MTVKQPLRSSSFWAIFTCLRACFSSAFPSALFDQLVQQVAAEVTRQLQPASFLPAVQEPQVPSPAPAAFPSLAGTTDIQQLTTEVPVVSSSPVGNPSAVDQVTQVVQSVHSSLAGESPSTGAFQPQGHIHVCQFAS